MKECMPKTPTDNVESTITPTQVDEANLQR
jgi:hypothetical protein